MNHSLMTPEDVLQKIGAPDFRSISKSQLVEFVSSIPDMDREVAMQCIAQFPEVKGYANEMVHQLHSLADTAISEHRIGRKDAVDAYRLILDNLDEKLKDDDISSDDRKSITSDMIDVADRIASLARDNTTFLQNVLTLVSGITAGALAVGGAILGAKIINKK